MANITLQRDGLTLVGTREEPFGEIYDMAIIFHGFNGNRNSRLLTSIADQLRDENVASVRFDFNGHGDSDGEFRNSTVLNEIADANTILEYVKTDPHVRNIYLIGHSQGGVIASMLAGLYPDLIKKVVLLAPAATLKDDARKGYFFGTAYNPKKVPAEVRHAGVVIDGFYARIAQNLPIYEWSSQFTGPVCLIHGKEDKVVDPKASEKYAETYENAELHLLDDTDHSFSAEDKLAAAVKLVTDFVKPNEFQF